MKFVHLASVFSALSLAACGSLSTGSPTPAGLTQEPSQEAAATAFEALVAATATALHLTALSPSATPRALAPGATSTPAETASASAPPLASSTPAPTSTPASGGVSLGVNQPNPQPGEALTFAWESAAPGGPNGHCLTLTNDSSDLTAGAVTNWCDLPSAGTLTVSIPTVARDRFRVYLDGGQGRVDIHLPCPDRYFFDDISTGNGWALAYARDYCPAPAVYGDAVEQDFEGGRMLLFDNRIYVLQGNGAGTGNYVQLFDAGAHADATPTGLEPPADKFLPDSATFENTWRTASLLTGMTVREAMGWAVAPAQTFQGAAQHPWQTQFVVDENGALQNRSGPYSYFQYLRLSGGHAAFVSLYIGHGMRPYWVDLNS